MSTTTRPTDFQTAAPVARARQRNSKLGLMLAFGAFLMLAGTVAVVAVIHYAGTNHAFDPR